MRALTLCLVVLCLPAVAAAQNPLKIGGGDGEQPKVRIADDPLQAVRNDQQTLLRRQQELPWKEAEGWATEQAQVRARRIELEARRERYLLEDPPAGAERQWAPEDEGLGIDPDLPVAAPDDGPPAGDGGPGDGGVTDGGRPSMDAGVPDAAVAPDAAVPAGDGGVASDGGPDGGVVAPPEPKLDLLPVVPFGERFLPPRIHPDEVVSLDETIALLRAQERTLASLQRLHNEQAAQITAALAQADALLQAAEKKKDEKATFSLRDVEKVALQLHLARIEEALARARQRSTPDDGEDAAPTASKPTDSDEPSSLGPARAYEESQERAEQLREQGRVAQARINRITPRIRLMRRSADETRQIRDALDLMFAQRELVERERTLQEALDKLVIPPEDVEWTAKKLETSKKLRAESIAQIEEELDTLRSAAAHAANEVATGDDEDQFADARVRAKRIMFLKEKLAFERLKLQRDQLWYDLARYLPIIIRGEYPPQEFMTSTRDVIEPRRMKERQVDLETRCDGWRRARNTADRQEPAPGKEFNKELLMEVYAGLADLCMREEWVLGTESRLGEVARFHLQRLEWSSRSVWWYVWRGFASLVLLGLIALTTRGLRWVTRRLAGTEQLKQLNEATLSGRGVVPDMRARLARLRGTVALVLYLASLFFLWLWVIILAGRYLWGVPLEWSDLMGWATHPIFLVGQNEVSIWSLVQLVLWFFAGLWASRMTQSFVTSGLLDHFAVERGIRDAVGTMIRYLVIAVALAVGLASVGIGLGALGLLFGVIGIGIGFGLQSIALNFISGFILLFERPIRRGDYVQVDDLVGEVKDISARATTLETRDGITVIVPNSEFISDRVINWTLGRNERVRAQVRVGVAYGTDVALVERLLLEVGRADKNVLTRPAPTVHMEAFGDSALLFVLHVWTRKIRGLPAIISELNKAVDATFKAHGIEIPYPQRTVHHF
ncbi:MAG: mechanosensitive ion channel, partial [Myxococcales bacterium]|nr:mechanosensitive ion channel [Myxococcales bacterium]